MDLFKPFDLWDRASNKRRRSQGHEVDVSAVLILDSEVDGRRVDSSISRAKVILCSILRKSETNALLPFADYRIVGNSRVGRKRCSVRLKRPGAWIVSAPCG